MMKSCLALVALLLFAAAAAAAAAEESNEKPVSALFSTCGSCILKGMPELAAFLKKLSKENLYGDAVKVRYRMAVSPKLYLFNAQGKEMKRVAVDNWTEEQLHAELQSHGFIINPPPAPVVEKKKEEPKPTEKPVRALFQTCGSCILKTMPELAGFLKKVGKENMYGDAVRVRYRMAMSPKLYLYGASGKQVARIPVDNWTEEQLHTELQSHGFEIDPPAPAPKEEPESSKGPKEKPVYALFKACGSCILKSMPDVSAFLQKVKREKIYGDAVEVKYRIGFYPKLHLFGASGKEVARIPVDNWTEEQLHTELQSHGFELVTPAAAADADTDTSCKTTDSCKTAEE